MRIVFRTTTFAAAVIVVLLAGACQAWTSDQRPVPEVVQEHRDGKVALSTNNVGKIVVSNPTIEGDSIVGTRTGVTGVGSSRTAIPVSEVRSVETRQLSVVRTLVLGVLIALGAVLAFYEP